MNLLAEKTVVLDKNSLKAFREKAGKLKPELRYTMKLPADLIRIERDGLEWKSRREADISELPKLALKKNDKICLDFGEHMVGYLSFSIKAVNALPDAPAFLRLKFGEKLCEIAEERENYSGILSSSWIQEEYFHVDVMPAVIMLPRRYAFRYLEIMVIDTSSEYEVSIDKVVCKTVSSADLSAVPKFVSDNKLLCEIDRVSVKTLYDCMQDVFEDGPKRDRRLWIGDLKLQALANYETFKNYDLVKRCLYLFAGLVDKRGRVCACVYTVPDLVPADFALFDYSLLFVSCLYDYYRETGDRAFLQELYPTARRQLILSEERLDDDFIVRDSDDWWCFIDWNDRLNKQAGAQAVFIYTLKQARRLAVALGEDTDEYDKLIQRMSNAAKALLWDREAGFFVSGRERQISWASQIWFVLAGVFDMEENRALLLRMLDSNLDIKLKTPYMYHYLIEAMLQSGMEEAAFDYLQKYWGGMLADGADCFYEIYDMEDKMASPYGSRIINSYCHAWSCTPAYFIRKYKNQANNVKVQISSEWELDSRRSILE